MGKAPYFLVIFTRITAFLAFVPFFKERAYTRAVKAGFAFMISLLLTPTLPIADWTIPTDLLGFLWIMTGEILVGIVIGFAFLALLLVLEIAGRVISFQMAFSMANVMDATFGTNSSVLSVILLMVGTLVVIMMGGDAYLLLTLKKSFTIIPPGMFASTKSLLHIMSNMIMHAFDLGFRLAAPAVVLLLCVDITLGLIGKTAQKMQIFFVGLPLKIAIGLFSFTLLLDFVGGIWAEEIYSFPKLVMEMLKSMRI